MATDRDFCSKIKVLATFMPDSHTSGINDDVFFSADMCVRQ